MDISSTRISPARNYASAAKTVLKWILIGAAMVVGLYAMLMIALFFLLLLALSL